MKLKLMQDIQKKKQIVYSSSSGGLFRIFADEFMKMYPNGKVCAVIWDEDFKGVHHELGGEELLERMQRSKYVQSRKNLIYKKNKRMFRKRDSCIICGLSL